MTEAERVSLRNAAGARSLPNIFEIACECFHNARVRCAQRGPMVIDASRHCTNWILGDTGRGVPGEGVLIPPYILPKGPRVPVWGYLCQLRPEASRLKLA
jgi:hypothetical protein